HEHFEQLARTIRVEAEKLGLGEKLPQPDTSPFNPECDPPAFLGQVNLPGCWFIRTGFCPTPTRRWRDAMFTLQALALDKAADRRQADANPDADRGQGGAGQEERLGADHDQGAPREVSTTDPPGNQQQNKTHVLSPLQYDILDALRAHKAFDPEKRVIS